MSDFADRLASALSDRYRIDSEVGAGGMATAYLLGDPREPQKDAVHVAD